MKLKELKPNKLSNRNLNNRQMNHLKGGSGGNVCGCSCYYENSGGSSTMMNGGANYQYMHEWGGYQ
jgi:natural product precursor